MEYKLQPNEILILRHVNVSKKSSSGAYNHTLILTNLHLVFVEKNLFGKVKDTRKYPLSQIKVFNGTPQVLSKRDMFMTNPYLAIHFVNGAYESFGFPWGSEVKKWVNAIHQVIAGASDDLDLSELQKDSDPLTKAAEIFFGFTGKNSRDEDARMVTKSCVSCSAPLTGKIGKTIRCQYCDTSQAL